MLRTIFCTSLLLVTFVGLQPISTLEQNNLTKKEMMRWLTKGVEALRGRKNTEVYLTNEKQTKVFLSQVFKKDVGFDIRFYSIPIEQIQKAVAKKYNTRILGKEFFHPSFIKILIKTENNTKPKRISSTIHPFKTTTLKTLLKGQQTSVSFFFSLYYYYQLFKHYA